MNFALEALKAFQLKGAIIEVAPFGTGHINDTYKVKTSIGAYLLQKLNTKVFGDTIILESNLKQLLDLRSQVLAEHIPTVNGQYLAAESDGHWKLQVFIANTYAPKIAISTDTVEQVGIGFGSYTAMASGLDPKNLGEAIPNFHNLNWRLTQLREAIKNNTADRLDNAEGLLAKVKAFEWISDCFQKFIEKGLPLRVCHNDTKGENILLESNTNQFQSVVDLDTAGPGYVLYDFGDMMRTLLSPTTESELDIDKIQVNTSYLLALRKGFLQACDKSLTSLEIESLHFGGYYMTYMQAIRFLTDYLNGDIYYKIHFPEENYIRARNQFRLLELLNEHIEL